MSKTAEYQQAAPGVWVNYPPPATAATFQFQQHRHQLAPGQWSTGLCDCFDDVGNCCITCLCPCITFGQVAEIVDRGSSSCGASGALYGLICALTGCQCIYSCLYRSKLRSQYSLSESPCPDFCVHWCCETCAICQEYRELRNRGFDMNIDYRVAGKLGNAAGRWRGQRAAMAGWHDALEYR